MTLRELWVEAVRLTHEASQATARAHRAQADLNEALAVERARLLVPPGLDVDFLGDGAVRPAGECRQHPDLTITPR